MKRTRWQDPERVELAADPATPSPSAGEDPPPVARLSHRERLASLGVLAAGVGHEINNPLASMLACLHGLERLLEDGLATDEARDEARELCRLLGREVDRCRETTSKLMLLAQPYSSTPGDVDFNAIVTDTLSLLRFQIRRQGIRVVESLQPALPPMWARDSGMRSVAMNLILNAVQAMPAGGVLTVTTRKIGDSLEFTVQDTGSGVPEEILERIWDPFFTTKPAGEGTGLGLPVTGAIARRHGGTVRIESPDEGGARFRVRLPFRQEQAP